MSSYYFDASDAAATDPNNVWTSDANAFDGKTTTTATCATPGSVSSNYLMAEGTNAPASGAAIIDVQARIWGFINAGPATTNYAAIYTDALGELLGTATVVNKTGIGFYGEYVKLTPPSGGWTWTKIAALEVKIYTDANSGTYQTAQVALVEVEVNPTLGSRIYRVQGFQ